MVANEEFMWDRDKVERGPIKMLRLLMWVLSVRQLLKIHESSYDRSVTAIQINAEYLSKSLMQMQT